MFNRSALQREPSRDCATSTSHEQPFPKASPDELLKGTREAIARTATHYLTSSLLESGYSLNHVNNRSFGEECYARLLTFSDDTLATINKLSVKATIEGEEPVSEYALLELLVLVQAEEADYVNAFAMRGFLERNDVLNADDSIAIVLSLKLYDQHVLDITGIELTTMKERKRYYEALMSVTMALEDAEALIAYEQGEAQGREYHNDTPPVIYCEITPDQRALSTSPVIGDQRMIDLVIRNVNRAGEISGFIKERACTDPDVINEYLTAPCTVLANGSL